MPDSTSFSTALLSSSRAGSAPVEIAEIADEVQDFLSLLHVVEERLRLVDALDWVDVQGRRLGERLQA